MDIFFILQFPREITAVIIRDHSVGKSDLKVTVLQFMQIYLTNMEHTVGSFQYRRRKYLPYRNIHIGDTILENSLVLGILQFMEPYPEICPVPVTAENMHVFSLI